MDTLLAVLRPSLVAFFSRRVAPDLAEDLTQNALIRITRALDQMDVESAREHVAMVVRTMMYQERLRQERAERASSTVAHGEVAEPSCAITEQIEYQELVRAVRRVSAAILPPELKSVVNCVLRDLSHAEIAAELKVTRIAVRARLLRARVLLRRELTAYLSGAALLAGVSDGRDDASLLLDASLASAQVATQSGDSPDK